MTVFDDSRVKRYAWTTDEGYDVDTPGESWAVVFDDAGDWWARSYRDSSGKSDRGPFSNAEQAITAVLTR